VTAPLTDRLLVRAAQLVDDHRDMESEELAELLREAALELARLESQLEAVRLAKPAYHQPPYVDGYFGER
jgi:Ni,Fe-hydrogenase III large subunit